MQVSGQLPSTLSSGQRRRLALASAFAGHGGCWCSTSPRPAPDAEGVEWLGTSWSPRTPPATRCCWSATTRPGRARVRPRRTPGRGRRLTCPPVSRRRFRPLARCAPRSATGGAGAPSCGGARCCPTATSHSSASDGRAMGGNVVLTLRTLAHDSYLGASPRSAPPCRGSSRWRWRCRARPRPPPRPRLQPARGQRMAARAPPSTGVRCCARDGRARPPSRSRSRSVVAAGAGGARRLLARRGCGLPRGRWRHCAGLRRHRRAVAGAREPRGPLAHLGGHRRPLVAVESLGDSGRRSGAGRAARGRRRGRGARRPGRRRTLLGRPHLARRRLPPGAGLHRDRPQPLRSAGRSTSA